MTSQNVLEQIFKLRKDINGVFFKQLLDEKWIDHKTYTTLRNPLCRRSVKKRLLTKALDGRSLTNDMISVMTTN